MIECFDVFRCGLDCQQDVGDQGEFGSGRFCDLFDWFMDCVDCVIGSDLFDDVQYCVVGGFFLVDDIEE